MGFRLDRLDYFFECLEAEDQMTDLSAEEAFHHKDMLNEESANSFSAFMKDNFAAQGYSFFDVK